MSYLKVHDDHVTLDLHFVASYWELNTGFGTLTFEICDTCLQIIFARCNHRVNEWNDKGTILTCQLCGEDVT